MRLATAILAAAIFASSLLFLLPNLHLRVFGGPRKALGLLGLMLFSFVFGLTIIAVIALQTDGAHPIVPDLRHSAPEAGGLVIVIVVLCWFGFAFTPLGTRAARHRAFLRQTKRDHGLNARQTNKVLSSLSAYAEDQARAHHGIRRYDAVDWIIGLPLGIILIGGCIAFRLSPVVQTAALDQVLRDNMIPGIMAAGVLVLGPAVLNMALRAPTSLQQANMSRVRKLFAFGVGFPLLATLLYALAAFELAPTVWTYATHNSEATIRYEVIDLPRRRGLENCIRIRPVDASDQQMMVCALGADFADRVRPGTVFDAQGELSQFGHAITAVALR